MKMRPLDFLGFAALLLAGCATTSDNTARVEPPNLADLVPMTVLNTAFQPESGAYVILLQSAETNQPAVRIPIYVGEREAGVLSMKLARQTSSRPLTHDLALSMVSALGGQIRHVVIEDIQDQVFLARIYMVDRQGRWRAVDSRASDAIIIGVATGVQIHATRPVIDKAGLRLEKSRIPAIDI